MIRLNGQLMEEVNDLNILTPSDANMKAWREKQQTVLQRRKVVGSLEYMMRGKTVSMKERKKKKKVLRDGIMMLTLVYASETWT